MRLPIPVQMDGGLLMEAKMKQATAEVLAAARREAEAGEYYAAILEWCAGVTQELTGPEGAIVTSKDEIRRATRAMPFVSAWAVACFGMAETKGSDAIPGSYKCPKCGKVIEVGPHEKDGERWDDSDRLSSIEYKCLDDPSVGVQYELTSPVEILRKDTGAVVASIGSISMSYPTLGQCIRAQQAYPDDESMLMFAVYAESLTHVDGKKVEPAWRSSYGKLVFSRMTARDINALSAALNEYSMSVKVERACPKCKNRWEAELDLSGFFASGLEPH